MNKHPKSYDEGFKAYNDGVKVGDDPYPEASPDFWHWMAGWCDAGLEKHKRQGA